MKRVLIVDDEYAIAEALSGILELEGYEVCAATSGEDALGCLQWRRFDAVLSDVMMPAMDGRELLGRIRADVRTERLPVILMSAAGPPPDLPQLPCSGFVSKPFELDELLDRLSEVTADSGDGERRT
jgi:CheY-like chemotaxis protein